MGSWMLSTFGESKKGCSGESYSSLMFNSDLVQCWSAMVPIPAIGLIELGMATVGRFLPLSAALRQCAMMLQCMRRESATCRLSSNSEAVI